MNKVLVLAMLCVASANCSGFENLCSSDSFEYDGVLVNAFYRTRSNWTFGSLSDYLIDDTVKCNLSEFKNETNFWEALRLKHAHNRKFAELYTENLIGNTAEELRKKMLQLSFVAFMPLFDMKYEETKAKCVKFFLQKASSGAHVFKELIAFFDYNKHAISGDMGALFEPNRRQQEEADKLEKLINELRTNSHDQTLAFQSGNAMDILWRKPVFLPKEFKFLKEGSDRVGPDTKSMLPYDLLLPSNNKNHDNVNCVSGQDLSWFYKRKGN